MRGRGLKPLPLPVLFWLPDVALHAGAWIETLSKNNYATEIEVALHAGAWIETFSAWESLRFAAVALHAGAWIETDSGWQ